MTASSTATRIHPSAIVDPSAILAEGVQIEPYAIIKGNVSIGANTVIGSHAVIDEGTLIGENCRIDTHAIIGGPPQDVNFKNEVSGVRIGDRTQIREFSTVNRANGEGNMTLVGSDCMLMAYSHVAHNCVVGNNVIMANLSHIAGYVELGDYVFLSGQTIIHQFVKVGRMAIMGGASATRQDLPPFSMSEGRPARICGINKVGLKRRGLTLDDRQRIRKAYQILFFSKLNLEHALHLIASELPMDDPYIQELIEFVKTSKRGISRHLHDDPERDEETFQSLTQGMHSDSVVLTS